MIPSTPTHTNHHHRSTGAFMSDGGGLGTSASVQSHHHHSISSPSPSLSQPPASSPSSSSANAPPTRPAGLASTEFPSSHALMAIAPTGGKYTYESKRAYQVLHRQSHQHPSTARKTSLLNSPSSHSHLHLDPQLSPQKSSTHRNPQLSPQKSSHRKTLRSSSRVSHLVSNFEPLSSPNSHNGTGLAPPWSGSRRRLNMDAVAIGEKDKQLQRDLQLQQQHFTKALVLNSPSHANTAPESGLSIFPNFVQLHGQIQTLLAAASDMQLLSKDDLIDMETKTSTMFQKYVSLVMEMQRPPEQQAKVPETPSKAANNQQSSQEESKEQLNDTIQHQEEHKDQNETTLNSAEKTAELLDAAAGSTQPSTADESTTFTHSPLFDSLLPTQPQQAPSTLTSPQKSSNIDLNMHQPLPDNLFYSSASASTMPLNGSPSTNTTLPLPSSSHKIGQTMRKSFKLSDIESIEDGRIEIVSTKKEKPQPKQARVVEEFVLQDDDDHTAAPVQLVTSLALQSSEDHPDLLNQTVEEDEATIDRRGTFRRDASYIVQSRVSHGDIMAGAKYDWEKRTYENCSSELRQEHRQSFQIQENGGGFDEQDMMQVVQDENRPPVELNHEQLQSPGGMKSIQYQRSSLSASHLSPLQANTTILNQSSSHSSPQIKSPTASVSIIKSDLPLTQPLSSTHRIHGILSSCSDLIQQVNDRMKLKC